MTTKEIIAILESDADPEASTGMARYGITGKKVYGIRIPALRKLAMEIGKDHALALDLWSIESRETRILASMIDKPGALTNSQMESWVSGFDSWEVCDQCIMNLFEKHPLAWEKAVEWSWRDEEFVKRAGYVLMARLAVSDRTAGVSRFISFLPHIERGSIDDRNFVKKAVNWALREIGKRNRRLNAEALACAGRILTNGGRPATWIARDAIRELKSPSVQARLATKPRGPETP